MTGGRKAWLASLVVTLIVCAPAALGWLEHDGASQAWYANYVAGALTRDGWPPLLIDTDGAQGDPTLLYYGLPLYVALAPFVVLLGPVAGSLAAAVGLQFLLLYRLTQLARRAGLEAAFGWGLAVAAGTSVYWMTNLFNRGAVVEALAQAFVGLALLALTEALSDSAESPRAGRLAEAVAASVLAFASHPPTLYLGVLFLALPALVWLFRERRALLRAVGGVRRLALLVGIGLVPLGSYAARALRDRPLLELSYETNAGRLLYLADTVDRPLARLWPLPMDLRVDLAGVGATVTPWLSAAVNVALFGALLVWHLRERRRTALPALVSAGLALALSLPLPCWPLVAHARGPLLSVAGSWLEAWLSPVQFAYRLAGLVQLALLLATLQVMLATARLPLRVPPPSWQHLIGLALATLSCAGLTTKAVQALEPAWLVPDAWIQDASSRGDHTYMWHSARLPPDERRAQRVAVHDLTRLPPSAYSNGSYRAARAYRFVELDSGNAIVVTTRRVSSALRRFEIECAAASWVVTDVVPTAPLRVVVDGAEWSRGQLAVTGPRNTDLADGPRVTVRDRWTSATRLALPLAAGHHEVLLRLAGWPEQLHGAFAFVAALAYWVLLLFRR